MSPQELTKTMFFRGLSADEISEALSHLNASVRTYQKDEVILHTGDTTRYMCLVLSGSVTIESYDVFGNRTILSHVGRHLFFAETYAYLPHAVLLVDARANEDSEILFLEVRRLAQPALPDSGWRARLTANLLDISVHKNLLLSRRSLHTSSKTIRGRVLSYLRSTALQTHHRAFEIPFDRQQFADYLNVERTALSKELGKMKADGILRFRKNRFELLDDSLSWE
ncbi:MAG: Crp/Fnr family transcriptional regulator [Ndongobacter sp.]|nr:Crp/Fnr family transcriptional regulator [Ndongobacter sp.]